MFVVHALITYLNNQKKPSKSHKKKNLTLLGILTIQNQQYMHTNKLKLEVSR